MLMTYITTHTIARNTEIILRKIDDHLNERLNQTTQNNINNTSNLAAVLDSNTQTVRRR